MKMTTRPTAGEVSWMETIERIESQLKAKIEPLARRVYVSARAVITAPDQEPGARPSKPVLQRMIAWFKAEDADPEL